MEQNAPVESGIAQFLNQFGTTVAKGSQNQQKDAGKIALEDYKASKKKELAEDTNKVKAQNNAKGPQNTGRSGGGGKSDPALASAKKAMAAVDAIQRDKDKYIKNALSSAADPGHNFTAANHVVALTKQYMAQGLDATQARQRAANKAYADDNPDKAQVLVHAYGLDKTAPDYQPGGQMGTYLKQYPQLAQEHPNIGVKYGFKVTPVSTTPAVAPPTANPAGAATPVPATPKPQAMAPMPQQASPQAPPMQVAQAPQSPVQNQNIPSLDNSLGGSSPMNQLMPEAEQDETAV